MPEVVLNEAVLRRPLADRPAMAKQLHPLTAVGRQDDVSVRVLPLGARLHHAALAGGSFVTLDFPDTGRVGGAEPSTVYSDGLTGALYLDKPTEVAAYNAAWAKIVTSSLDETRSTSLIAAIATEYESS